MTLPSTEELQRLLDAATPGEWKWDGTVRRSLYSKDAEGKGREIIKCAALLYPDEADAEIIAHSRAIAAEVIRLRQGINDLKKAHVDALNHPVGDGSLYFHSNAIFELSRILEGDQT